MKKFKHTLIKILALVLSAITMLGAVACGNTGAGTGGNTGGNGGGGNTGGGTNTLGGPQDLQILLLYKGYQDEWLDAVIELFKQEDWVKEKYPQLNVKKTVDGTDSLPVNKLNGGASLNEYDLIFSVNLKGYEGGGITADLTDSVYLTEVPGEPGVKVKDKIEDFTLNYAKGAANRIKERDDGENSYYIVNYIKGCGGILYNEDLLNKLGKELPLTTIQFRDLCHYVIDTGYTYNIGAAQFNANAAIMAASETGYWAPAFPVWWAQYEGFEEFENFYNGVYDGVRSSKVLTQTGRLRALEELEYIFRSGCGYEYMTTTSYLDAQTNFLSGEGLFHYIGDFYDSEMRSTRKSLKEKYGIDYNIKYMKTPVISSIVEKLELYTEKGTPYTSLSDARQREYDVILQGIIKDIDDNKLYDESVSKTKGISKKDFDKIVSARSIQLATEGMAQTAVVPDYASAKNLAFDFLRFMYTDKAIKAFAIASEGTIFPVKYDYLGDPEVYSALSSISKSKLEIYAGTSNYPTQMMPSPSCYPLGAAGLVGMSSLSGSYELAFSMQTGELITAKDLYERDIAYWNETTWGQMLARAGLSAN